MLWTVNLGLNFKNVQYFHCNMCYFIWEYFILFKTEKVRHLKRETWVTEGQISGWCHQVLPWLGQSSWISTWISTAILSMVRPEMCTCTTHILVVSLSEAIFWKLASLYFLRAATQKSVNVKRRFISWNGVSPVTGKLFQPLALMTWPSALHVLYLQACHYRHVNYRGTVAAIVIVAAETE